jgi:hypothetical protein
MHHTLLQRTPAHLFSTIKQGGIKMKRLTVLTVAAFSFAFFAIGNGPATAEEKGMLTAPTEEIIIDGQKPARFSHQKHLDLQIDCGTCHHDAKHQPLTAEAIGTMENAEKLKCQSCHNADFANSELNSQKLVFHARCKECHQKGVGDKKGPTKCTDCHIKQEG